MSCCGKGSRVKYEVTFTNGSPKQTYSTVGEATAAGKATGKPFTFKAVRA